MKIIQEILMRYLSTILLTTTFLTATTTYGSTITTIDNSTSQSAAASATSFSAETQAKINAFEVLVSSRSDFNISDAAEILFSPELFPLISWRSDIKNQDVVSQLARILSASLSKGFNRNNLLIVDTIEAIIFPEKLESSKAPTYHESKGIAEPTKLNELVDGTICWGWYRNVLSHYDLTFTPELRLKLYLELLHQTNITPDSLGHILRTTTELTKMFMSEPKQTLDETVENFKSGTVKELDQFYKFDFPYLFMKEKLERGTPSEAFAILQQSFDKLETRIDGAFNDTHQITNQVLTSFGPNAIALFSEIFNALRPIRKQKLKIKSKRLKCKNTPMLLQIY